MENEPASYLSRAWYWINESVEAHPEGWAIGAGLLLAMMLGAWLHKKATKKEKKA